jgi:hypothetical protein
MAHLRRLAASLVLAVLATTQIQGVTGAADVVRLAEGLHRDGGSVL